MHLNASNLDDLGQNNVNDKSKVNVFRVLWYIYSFESQIPQKMEVLFVLVALLKSC